MTDTAVGKTFSTGAVKSEPDRVDVDAFLAAFNIVAPVETAPIEKITLKAAKTAYQSKDWKSLKSAFEDAKTSAKQKQEILNRMLAGNRGAEAMRKDPELAAYFISQADPDFLARTNLFGDLGDNKLEILNQSMLAMAKKAPPTPGDTNPDRSETRDPRLFKLLAKQIDPKTWNDKDLGLGQPKRDLGPRMCARLLKVGAYDEICTLIAHGVDTTTGSRERYEDRFAGLAGAYSGFVMPIQHTLQPYLPEIAKLGTTEAAGWDAKKRAEIEGAKNVFETLERTGTAVTLTDWTAVKSSDVLSEFKKNPGTIWGFESVRGPYVQAAHETAQGKQPVRMMELWDAVTKTISQIDFEEFLADPAKMIPTYVASAAQQVASDMDKATNPPKPGDLPETFAKYEKYHRVVADRDNYLAKFKEDAKALLEEIASQMPKQSFGRVSKDDGRAVSDIAGTAIKKYMSSFACQAGLWNAKNQGKPVYYCLDGINMDDVATYKKEKSDAVEAYLQDHAAGGQSDPFEEVVSMKEVREILRNWDEFKDTVKFFLKGKILTGKELQNFIDKYQNQMAATKQAVGRKAAPPRAQFQKELEAFDKKLPKKLNARVKSTADDTKADQDARDIVRKAGYMTRVSNTNPRYLIRYLLNKCDVLFEYELIHIDLAGHAAHLGNLAAASEESGRQRAAGNDKIADALMPTDKTVEAAVKSTVSSIKKCAPVFQEALASSLVRFPLTQANPAWVKRFAKI